jgi:hypothetical protein
MLNQPKVLPTGSPIKELVFETWNKDEVGLFNTGQYISNSRMTDQITGNYKREENVKYIGVFMYQEIREESLESLRRTPGVIVKWSSNQNINVNELVTARDYCSLYHNGKLCGSFVLQKSWNGHEKKKFNTLNNLHEEKNKNIISLSSYNGIICSPEITFFNFEIPNYFRNQQDSPGYRSSYVCNFSYKNINFSAISFHGTNPAVETPPNANPQKLQDIANKKQRKLKIQTDLLQNLTANLSSKENVVWGGDFNIDVTTMTQYLHGGLFGSFQTKDIMNEITTFNKISNFSGKLDWIFYKFNPQKFNIQQISPYTGKINLIEDGTNPADHTRVNITVPIFAQPAQSHAFAQQAHAQVPAHAFAQQAHAQVPAHAFAQQAHAHAQAEAEAEAEARYRSQKQLLKDELAAIQNDLSNKRREIQNAEMKLAALNMEEKNLRSEQTKVRDELQQLDRFRSYWRVNDNDDDDDDNDEYLR